MILPDSLFWDNTSNPMGWTNDNDCCLRLDGLPRSSMELKKYTGYEHEKEYRMTRLDYLRDRANQQLPLFKD